MDRRMGDGCLAQFLAQLGCVAAPRCSSHVALDRITLLMPPFVGAAHRIGDAREKRYFA